MVGDRGAVLERALRVPRIARLSRVQTSELRRTPNVSWSVVPPLLPLRQALAQPADLAAVIELVLEHVKPLEVVVHFPGTEGALLVEPCIVALGELIEREAADPLQSIDIVLQRLAAQRRPRPV